MNYGPLEPYLRRVAFALARWLRSYGFSAPSDSVLIPALLVSLLSIVLGLGFLSTLIFAPTRCVRDAVLIVGASPLSTVAAAPGKTTLYHVLRTGHAPPYGTVPSQDVNEATFMPSMESLRAADAASEDTDCSPFQHPVRWIDFPGHARLRPLLQERLATARVIVLVVDAAPVAFARTLRETADLLYDIVVHPVVVKKATPLLVFCNKHDLPSCVSPTDIRVKMEAELERARKSRASALSGAQNAVVAGAEEGLGASTDEDRPALGYDDEEFNFDHIPNDVRFVAGSAKQRNVSAVCRFVSEYF